jgi:hypothetical protein
MPKDTLIRTALDVRKVGAAHSGSALMCPISPQQAAVNRYPSCTWSLSSVAIGKVAGPYISIARSVILIAGGAKGGTVDFNIETHTADFETDDTDLMAADLVVDSTGEIETAMALYQIPAGCWIWLDISDMTGAITQFSATLVLK